MDSSSDTRRIVVFTWHPPDSPGMARRRCHMLWQVSMLGGGVRLHATGAGSSWLWSQTSVLAAVPGIL